MCIKPLKSLSMLLILTGCAGINGKFDCPYKLGISCKSVSEVNDLVDRGKLPAKFTKNTTAKATVTVNTTTTTVTEWRGAKRIPEKILTVWLAPFVDQAGNYHGGSFLTAVIQPAKWLQQGAVNS
jgi:conjugal transfer pilus assembly protein TraV